MESPKRSAELPQEGEQSAETGKSLLPPDEAAAAALRGRLAVAEGDARAALERAARSEAALEALSASHAAAQKKLEAMASAAAAAHMEVRLRREELSKAAAASAAAESGRAEAEQRLLEAQAGRESAERDVAALRSELEASQERSAAAEAAAEAAAAEAGRARSEAEARLEQAGAGSGKLEEALREAVARAAQATQAAEAAAARAARADADAESARAALAEASEASKRREGLTTAYVEDLRRRLSAAEGLSSALAAAESRAQAAETSQRGAQAQLAAVRHAAARRRANLLRCCQGALKKVRSLSFGEFKADVRSSMQEGEAWALTRLESLQALLERRSTGLLARSCGRPGQVPCSSRAPAGPAHARSMDNEAATNPSGHSQLRGSESGDDRDEAADAVALKRLQALRAERAALEARRAKAAAEAHAAHEFIASVRGTDSVLKRSQSVAARRFRRATMAVAAAGRLRSGGLTIRRSGEAAPDLSPGGTQRTPPSQALPLRLDGSSASMGLPSPFASPLAGPAFAPWPSTPGARISQDAAAIDLQRQQATEGPFAPPEAGVTLLPPPPPPRSPRHASFRIERDAAARPSSPRRLTAVEALAGLRRISSMSNSSSEAVGAATEACPPATAAPAVLHLSASGPGCYDADADERAGAAQGAVAASEDGSGSDPDELEQQARRMLMSDWLRQGSDEADDGGDAQDDSLP